VETTTQSALTSRSAQWRHGFVSTNDGVKLHVIEFGSGPPLVLVPGWSQTAEEWKFQIDALSEHYHVHAVDMRGHGQSDKPDGGYRIARLAADLHDFLTAKNLWDVRLVAHSMGCSVLWSYLEQYRPERLKKIVFVDQMAAVVTNPAWSEAERTEAGSILDAAAVIPLDNALVGPDGTQTTAQFLGSMFRKSYPQADFDWVMAQNLQFPRKYAADLLYDHAFKDWRDVIRAITLPTLVIGGKASHVPWRSIQWIGSAISGARTVIFEEDEGGSHFMFLENPRKFNALVEEFFADES
jgi:non-heme chloroperoxidase